MNTRNAALSRPLPQLVLASSSPYRRRILERLGLAFETESPDVDESPRPGESPEALVARLAETKALEIGRSRPNALVIGSDQVADHDGAIVGKPRDHRDAVAQLSFASGRSIRLCTAVALLNTATGSLQSAVDFYTVGFRKLDRDTILRYLESEKPYDCCGSVRAEGPGIGLLESLRGDDPNTLIGLPVIKLCAMLESQGVRLF